MKLKEKLRHIKNTLKILWGLEKSYIILSIITAFLRAGMPFVGIFLSAYVLDGLQAKKEIRELVFVSLVVVSITFLLTILVDGLEKVNAVKMEICGQKYNMLMGERTIGMDFQLLESPMVEDIQTRIQNDNNWGAGIYSILWQFPVLVYSVLSCIISVVVVFPIFLTENVFADITGLVVLGIFIAVLIFSIKYNSIKQDEEFKLISDSSSKKSYLSHFLWSTQDYHYGKDIRVYKAQGLIESSMVSGILDRKKWIKQVMKNHMEMGFGSSLAQGLMQCAAYVFVALRAVSGALSVGSVLKYASTIYQFGDAVSGMFSGFEVFSLSARRVQSTLDFINVSDVIPKGTLPVEKRTDNEYEIEFHNVSFKYPGKENYALRNLNLKLNIGKRLAVVGMNGSGKTTMIKLLCRLYCPTEGQITLNGIDINKYRYEEYINVFSVVFQDFKLFSFSLGQNVSSSMNYDKKDVEMALEESGFSERLKTMPHGTETCLYQNYSEDGVEISGGEAQKIAIARALYKDSPFIILDEPTAALDPVAEYEIYSKFNRVVGSKTAVYISHRLSSCRFCDDIAVFHEGELIQRGSHEVLIENPEGKYYELWNAQAQYYTD